MKDDGDAATLRGKGKADRATERAIAAARDALAHLAAAQTAIERSIRIADPAPDGGDMPEETAARLRDLDDGAESARARIGSARRRVASWVGLLEHAEGGRYRGSS